MNTVKQFYSHSIGCYKTQAIEENRVTYICKAEEKAILFGTRQVSDETRFAQYVL